jgi:hypothetical protein
MPFVFNPLSGQFDQTGSGAAQVNSDWNATSGVSQILNKPTIPSFDQSLNTTDSVTFNQVVASTALGSPSVLWGDFGTSHTSQGNPDGSIQLYDRPDFSGFAGAINALVAVAQELWFYRSSINKYKIMLAGLASSSDLSNSAAIALSTSANSFSAGQTITAPANTSALTASYSVTGANTTPLLNLSGTWNTSGIARGILLNVTDTASNASSLLMDLQVGGVSKFKYDKSGAMSLAGASSSASIVCSSPYFQINPTVPLALYVNSSLRQLVGSSVTEFRAGIALTTGGLGTAPEAYAYAGGANIWENRNSTNAQTFRLYGTYTDASNYRRLTTASTTAGIFTVTAEGAGTGASGNLLKLTAPILLPSTSVTLATNGDLAFEATSNTSLTIRYRGSDGTTRSATIALI